MDEKDEVKDEVVVRNSMAKEILLVALAVLVLVLLAVKLSTGKYSDKTAAVAGPAIKALVKNGMTDFEPTEKYLARTKVEKLAIPMLEVTDKGILWYNATFDADTDTLTYWCVACESDMSGQHLGYTKMWLGRWETPWQFGKSENYAFGLKNIPNGRALKLHATVPHEEFAKYTDNIKLELEYRPQSPHYNPDLYPSNSPDVWYQAGINLLKISVVNTVTGKVYGFKEFSEKNKDSLSCLPEPGVYQDSEGKRVFMTLKDDQFLLIGKEKDPVLIYELSGQSEKDIVQAGPYVYNCKTKVWNDRDQVAFTKK